MIEEDLRVRPGGELTRTEVAEGIGVSRRAINAIEHVFDPAAE